MGKEYDDAKKEKAKLDAAVKAKKPNKEQIQAHFRDTVAKLKKANQKNIEWAEDKLKKLKGE